MADPSITPSEDRQAIQHVLSAYADALAVPDISPRLHRYLVRFHELLAESYGLPPLEQPDNLYVLNGGK